MGRCGEGRSPRRSPRRSPAPRACDVERAVLWYLGTVPSTRGGASISADRLARRMPSLGKQRGGGALNCGEPPGGTPYLLRSTGRYLATGSVESVNRRVTNLVQVRATYYVVSSSKPVRSSALPVSSPCLSAWLFLTLCFADGHTGSPAGSANRVDLLGGMGRCFAWHLPASTEYICYLSVGDSCAQTDVLYLHPHT